MNARLYKDQLQREVKVAFPPQRIISLVPSQTELLYHLGLSAEVVGITKFCVHPQEWFRNKTRIGGTKQINIDQVRSLAPDLIIANKEENQQEQIEALAREFPVWISNIQSLEDALTMIRQVGELTNRDNTAHLLAQQIQDNFTSLQTTIQLNTTQTSPLPVAYFIWRNPWMVAGGDTFIHEMLKNCGWKNVFAHTPRYPETALEQLPLLFPADSAALILLSSEPYPFKEKHIAEIQAVLPHARIVLVDGEMFSWYGSRLLQAPAYFQSLIQQR
jgi:ABC-type Fe3+-hydroxamate transport system substrate-binding protein